MDMKNVGLVCTLWSLAVQRSYIVRFRRGVYTLLVFTPLRVTSQAEVN
jgi:hypothetical protein